MDQQYRGNGFDEFEETMDMEEASKTGFLSQKASNVLGSKESSSNATKYIMTTDGRDIEDNAFRLDIKSYRVMVAAAIMIKKCEAQGYTPGKELIELMLKLMPAVRGKRVGIFSDTVIGERRFANRLENGVNNTVQKFKNWAFNKQ